MQTRMESVHRQYAHDGRHEFCQPALQSACAQIQQSNELALKARICEVSPYLLLLNSPPHLSTTPKEIDFTALRTWDAVELPGAVYSLCSKKPSDKFIQTYNRIRSYRNQIAHLGETAKLFRAARVENLVVPNSAMATICGGAVTGILRAKCTVHDCKGDVIAKDGEHAGKCHTCGED